MHKYKNRVKSKLFDASYFLGCFLLISIFLVASAPKSFAVQHEISEIFIEASGNNKYEAKIKAHEQGMQRALLLIADKLKIPTDGIPQISYNELKEAFTPINLINEVSLLEKYNATVTYTYEKGKIYNLLLEYGDADVNDLFFEALVLPVFKQRNSLNIWDNEKKWNDFWVESRSTLNTYKLYYPEKTLYLSNKITPENLDDLTYEDFIEIFHNKLFKKVIIVTAEFFTNRSNGSSLMQIKKHILSPYGSKEVLEEEFDLNTWDDIPYTVNVAIDLLIDDYGMRRENESEILGEDNINEAEEEYKPIIMNFDVFDEDELELVTSKLDKIMQIDHFVIEHDYNNRYKILIYTDVSEYELAEGLYLNGLSYKIHGSLYNLIDVKKGS
ncbi:MAG: hypothetical protein NWS20_02815 [Rickettsiaceae bacterium]|nr:hypothetical protein [Rickettsiaceae bacterium]MDP4832273.1 hypothetical protein [Rickettsiaceae bacterium]MDP5020369.1 hypothetical protein [Rickettsiaceae bacterium]